MMMHILHFFYVYYFLESLMYQDETFMKRMKDCAKQLCVKQTKALELVLDQVDLLSQNSQTVKKRKRFVVYS